MIFMENTFPSVSDTAFIHPNDDHQVRSPGVYL